MRSALLTVAWGFSAALGKKKSPMLPCMNAGGVVCLGLG